MNILLFGATGMIGQGVLRECLRAADVETVQTIGRQATGIKHPKLHEMIVPDLSSYSPAEQDVASFDACFFCVGVSSVGMKAAQYEHATYDLTLTVAERLSKLNRDLTFVYVSGAGTDSTERGKVRWARVKGRTENALLRLPFRRAYMFRPGFVQPMHGDRSKTRVYRIAYMLSGFLAPLLRALVPDLITTTTEIGRAMLAVARTGASTSVVSSRNINALASQKLLSS